MSEKEKKSLSLAFLPRAFGGFAVCACALLLCAAVLYASNAAPLSTLGYACSVISFFSAVGAGAAATFERKERRLLIALVTGAALSAVLLLTGFLIKGKPEGSAVLSVVSFTVSGCLVGAILGVRKKKRTRFRSKRK